MQKRNYLVVASFVAATSLITSCSSGMVNTEECNDGSLVSINGIQELTFGRLVTFPIDQSPQVQFFATDESSTLDEGVKAIQIVMSYEVVTNQTSWFESLNFNIINSAHASCTQSSPRSDSELSDLQIVSNIEFSENNPAGSNLAEMFSIIEYTNHPEDDSGTNISEYISNAESAPINFILKYDGANDSLAEQTFTVSVSLDDGQIMFSADTLAF